MECMAEQIKKVLVTGGAGFIGSALIAGLQHVGHEIYVIDNLSFGNKELIKIPDSHFFELDILDRPELSRIVNQISPDWIIHLAAIHFIPYCNQHPVKASQVNIQGTINILDEAKNIKNLEKVFFASTAAVYPMSFTYLHLFLLLPAVFLMLLGLMKQMPMLFLKFSGRSMEESEIFS
jgi:UDP-glucose 4-epimerase